MLDKNCTQIIFKVNLFAILYLSEYLYGGR